MNPPAATILGPSDEKNEPVVRCKATIPRRREKRSKDLSNSRRDIERFLAIGGGSFDALLDMLGGERAPETVETASPSPGTPAWLPRGYLPEYGSDALILRRMGGSFVAAFSAWGPPGRPSCGPPRKTARDGRPTPDRRNTRTPRDGWSKRKANHPWERFLRTERRMLRARRGGQTARAMLWRLPGESQLVLDRIASEDRRRAEEGLVELRSEEGEFSCKHIEELSPEDRTDRIRAELARIEWLLERHDRRNIILRSNSFGQRQSRKSVG